MSVNTTLVGLSQTASSNGPDGSVDPPSTVDDAIKYALSFIATLRDGKGFTTPVVLASAGTTDIGAQNSMGVEISGTTTITSFGTAYNGPRLLRFTGALTLTHNASSLILPTAANIVTAAGDTCIAMPKTTAGTADGWVVLVFQRASGAPLLIADASVTAAKLSGAQTGSAPIYGVRAWMNYKGTATRGIRASGNVASVTVNGAGDFTMNYSTAMPTADYSPVFGYAQTLATTGQGSRTIAIHTQTTSSLRFICMDNGAVSTDFEEISVHIVC